MILCRASAKCTEGQLLKSFISTSASKLYDPHHATYEQAALASLRSLSAISFSWWQFMTMQIIEKISKNCWHALDNFWN
jgi:hypothetical protein